MARYRSTGLRRFRRRLGGRNGRLAVSAVAAGLVLAVIAGHAHTSAPAGGAQMSAAASSNVALGQQLAGGYGWGSGPQWTCLDELWTRESGWQAQVWNYGGSGAYGIPQALPATKMAAAGGDYMTDPATQIRWGLGYIASTYGTPCGAWAHETADGWY
jgi:resuscitation-promoting factor RpfB